jgi:type II secretory pathway predicted ATPase ExeA
VYFDFFGLKEAPFRITPNTEYWHAGGQRGEMLAALLYAVGQGEGIIKVVGEVGSGTTVPQAGRPTSRQRRQRLSRQPHLHDDTLRRSSPTSGSTPEAGGRPAGTTQCHLAGAPRSEARVVVRRGSAGHRADNLEFLRLLTNLETATDKLLQIVLFGQPELDVQLADPRIRQLKDRITLSLNLSPLTPAEVAEYLRARLAVAGYRGPDLFPAALITRMTQLSGGLSRRINVLADKTLLAAYAGNPHAQPGPSGRRGDARQPLNASQPTSGAGRG